MRYGLMCLFSLGVISTALLLGRASGEPPTKEGAKENPFGDVVLYVVTKPKDSKGELGFGLYEKPTIICLGDRSFIVGTLPDFGDAEVAKAMAGKRVWTPVSEILQMTEFKTLEEAKKWFEAARKPAEKVDR
jgi:hypothetical protein